jgi:hypothetical protein
VSSAALYEAAVAFLEADVLNAINLEQPGLMAPGSVTAARSTRHRFARRDKPHPVAVEIVLFRGREESEGMDSDRVVFELDVRCVVRRKDQSEGKEQAQLTADMARALVRHYRRVSDLSVPVAGAAFRYADAQIFRVDEDPSSGELACSVVRLTLTFSEVLA